MAAKDNGVSATVAWIAKGLIIIFGLGLVLSFAGVMVALVHSPVFGTMDTAFVEIFKSSLLILGGGLTTMIGYFFGSRDSAVAGEAMATTRTLQATERLVEGYSGVLGELGSSSGRDAEFDLPDGDIPGVDLPPGLPAGEVASGGERDV